MRTLSLLAAAERDVYKRQDYRSYYLHFECGVLAYKSSIIRDMKQDYIETLKDCREVTLDDCRKTPAAVRLIRAILNLFAPMM